MDQLESRLLDETFAFLANNEGQVLILGSTATGIRLRERLHSLDLSNRLEGIFDPRVNDRPPITPWKRFRPTDRDLIIVASDRKKELLLAAAAERCDVLGVLPEVAVSGTEHLRFADDVYDRLDAPQMVPSYATGYPNTRVHMYECLKAAAQNGLVGSVVEFGSFKGGTTAWLAQTVGELGLDSEVIGFDSWAGFPPRRSILDLYEHPRCVFTDIDSVRAYLEPKGIRLIEGDICETARPSLDGVPILLAFVDTDNYSPARAALEAVIPNLVLGGSIVFDHFTTTDDYVRTVGERMAGSELLDRTGFLHLHDTGVFTKVAP